MIGHHLEYAAVSWSPGQLRKRRCWRVQRRALRIVSNLRGKTYEARLGEAGLTSLEDRRVRGGQITTFRIMTGKCKVDPGQFFDFMVWGRVPWGGDRSVQHQGWVTGWTSGRHSFIRRVVNTWNSLLGFKTGYDEWVSRGRLGAWWRENGRRPEQHPTKIVMEISYITKREHLGEIEGLQENISPQPPGERAVFPSNFILNKWHSVDCYKIQPYIHQFSNNLDPNTLLEEAKQVDFLIPSLRSDLLRELDEQVYLVNSFIISVVIGGIDTVTASILDLATKFRLICYPRKNLRQAIWEKIHSKPCFCIK